MTAPREHLRPLIAGLSPGEQRQLWALLVETHCTRDADARALVNTLCVSPGANPSALGCLARGMGVRLPDDPEDETPDDRDD